MIFAGALLLVAGKCFHLSMFSVFTQLGHDDTPMVKRAAAGHLAKLIEVAKSVD
jgi:hypothetical protein